MDRADEDDAPPRVRAPIPTRRSDPLQPQQIALQRPDGVPSPQCGRSPLLLVQALPPTDPRCWKPVVIALSASHFVLNDDIHSSNRRDSNQIKTQSDGSWCGQDRAVQSTRHRPSVNRVSKVLDFVGLGGAGGTRTPGLLTASQTLSQLSYSPTDRAFARISSLRPTSVLR